jgi:hypothetical protein
MKFKGTATLAILFFGIILYYFLIDLPSENRKNEEKALSEKVISFNPEDVKTIAIVKAENTVELKRNTSEAWQMTKPVHAKGDFEAVSDFLSFLDNLNFTRVVDESSKKLSTFGLDAPKFQVILSMNDDEKKGLLVGDDHPMGNRLYLARLNEKRVLTADITKNLLDRNVYDLRDKTILDFKTTQINKIELTQNDQTLTFSKNKKSWQITKEKISAKGSESEITNFLNTIQDALVEQFVEEKPDQLTPYGLKHSKHMVKLTILKKKLPLTLFIGKRHKSGYYAKTLAKDNIFVIKKSLFDTLSNRQFVSFLNKSLVEFNDNDVKKVTLKLDNRVVELIRDKKDFQKWTMVKPIKMKANTATINSLLFDLKNTRIIDFAGDSKSFRPEQPEKEIGLTYKNGKTWSLNIGNQTSNADHSFAQRTNEEAIFSLKNSSIKSIFRSLYDLKDRSILDFDNDTVEGIQINDSKQNFILIKNADKWELTQPKPNNSIQSFLGNDILWTLNSIEFESVLTKDPGSIITGVTKPKLSVKLFNKKGEIIHNILIGNPLKKSPQTYYLKSTKNSVIYTIRKNFLNEIISNIKKLNETLQPN